MKIPLRISEHEKNAKLFKMKKSIDFIVRESELERYICYVIILEEIMSRAGFIPMKASQIRYCVFRQYRDKNNLSNVYNLVIMVLGNILLVYLSKLLDFTDRIFWIVLFVFQGRGK